MNDGWNRREAPDFIEQRLVGAFRAHHRGQRMWRTLAVAGIAAALTAIAWMAWPSRATPPHLAAVKRAPIPSPNAVARRPVQLVPVVASVPRKVRRRRVAPTEVATGFLPLDAAPMPLDGGAVIRMEVPRPTLALFGLPVDARRVSVPVQADVLFGEDGMAHAVRFVSTASYEVPARK